MDNPYTRVHGHEGEVMTYKEFCALLEIEEKLGRGRYLQFDDLEQYMKLDRKTEPRKIIIQEIYDSCDIKITHKRGKTLPFIKNKLLSILQKETSIRRTYRELFRDLQMGDQSYLNIKYRAKAEFEKIPFEIQEKYLFDIDPDFVLHQALYNFEMTSWVVIKEVLRSSLRQLSDPKKELITKQKSLRLLKEIPYEFNGETEYKMDGRSLSDQEQQEYMEIERDVLEKWGYEHLGKLYYSKGKKAEQARVYFENNRDGFIRDLGYEKAATEYIIDITEKGSKVSVDTRFLNPFLLQKEVGCTLYRDKDLHNIIPGPLLNCFILKYFGYVPEDLDNEAQILVHDK